jgi:hypothetical protein
MNAAENTVAEGSQVAFLVGAGRSGTTLLYKLLCLHPDVAYISNYENRFSILPKGWASALTVRSTQAKLSAWFNQGNAYFVQRPWAKKLISTPVEGEPVYARSGIPLHPEKDYRPDSETCNRLRDHFEKIRVASNSAVLLSKRTANNRRIPTLCEIFPQAKFIHLIRDGRDVAHSLSHVEWWEDHVLWWDGRRARDLESNGAQRLALCARNWVYEIAELRKSLASVPEGQVHELRYEDLLANPQRQLADVLKFLDLPSSAEFLQAVDSLQLASRPSRWPQAWAKAQLASVLQEELPTLRQLGYIE